jgi:cytochrome c peroxidase
MLPSALQPVSGATAGVQAGATTPGMVSQPGAPVSQPTSPPATSPPNVGAILGQAVGQTIGSLIQGAIQAPKIAALGQALFHDKILSGNRDVSCSTCHNQGTALTDGLSLSMGTGAVGVGPSRVLNTGGMTSRNAPALFDTGSSSYGGSSQSFFWDNRVSFSPLTTPDPELTNSPATADYANVVAQLTTPLAAQALFPVLDPTEMRGAPGTNEIADAPDNMTAWKLLMVRLVGSSNGTVGGIQGYRDLFQAAYPGVSFDDMNIGHATQAIAGFIAQSFNASNTPYDDYVNNGNTSALTASQVNGMNLFNGKANCVACHSGDSFSDFQPHGAAVPQLGPGRLEPGDDRGIALVTGSTADNYKFRTPSLRNVTATGPWMHDGAYTTLEGAVRHMLNPANGLAGYDSTQLRPDFAATLDTDPGRNAARAAAIDPVFASMPVLADSEVTDLVNFLGALTDPSSIPTAAAAKPSSVPSGLPID